MKGVNNEYQCDCTIFDSFLEYKYTSAEYTKNALIPSTYLGSTFDVATSATKNNFVS